MRLLDYTQWLTLLGEVFSNLMIVLKRTKVRTCSLIYTCTHITSVTLIYTVCLACHGHCHLHQLHMSCSLSFTSVAYVMFTVIYISCICHVHCHLQQLDIQKTKGQGHEHLFDTGMPVRNGNPGNDRTTTTKAASVRKQLGTKNSKSNEGRQGKNGGVKGRDGSAEEPDRDW